MPISYPVEYQDEITISEEKYKDFTKIIDNLTEDIENQGLTKEKLEGYWYNIKEYQKDLPNLVHDINNELLVISHKLLKKEDLKENKKAIEKLFLWETEYKINEIYQLAINRAKILWLGLEFVIQNLGSVYKITLDKEGKIIDRHSWAFIEKTWTKESTIKSLLKTFIPNLVKKIDWENIEVVKRFDINNIPVSRIISNTFKNSKEAWATKIKFVLTYWPARQMEIIKITDNWQWMSKDIIENTLFKKWVSSKENWQWIWMYWLVKDFLKYWWELEVHSLTKDWKFIEANYWYQSVQDNKINTLSIEEHNIEPEIIERNDEFIGNTWSQFVFKYAERFNLKNK